MQFKIEMKKSDLYERFRENKKTDDKIWSRTLRDSSKLRSLFWHFMRQHQMPSKISALFFPLDNFCGMEKRECTAWPTVNCL